VQLPAARGERAQRRVTDARAVVNDELLKVARGRGERGEAGVGDGGAEGEAEGGEGGEAGDGGQDGVVDLGQG